jgi:DNA primase catalytic core
MSGTPGAISFLYPEEGTMVEQEDINRIKETVDLVALIRSRGIDLKKNGKGYKGKCPFHEDDDPSFSVNPDRNLWHCFGCDKGGDGIRFVELIDGVDFKEAAKRLMETAPSASEARSQRTEARKRQAKETAEPKPLTPAHIKVLGRVIDFYHTAFCEDPRGREYLVGRGITDTKLFADHKIGFAGGTLMNVLPDEGDIKKQLQGIGILSDKGREHFYGCITFPLYDLAGNPAGIYGRRIMGQGADHLYLPGPRRGIFNRQAAIRDKEIILTEAVIDALTLMAAGIGNTIPCYGVNGLTDDHLTLFKQHDIQKIRICFDNDHAGRRGREVVAARLQEEGFTTEWLNLPEGQDINSFFLLTANSGEQFAALLRPGNQSEPSVAAPDPGANPAPAGPAESTITAEGVVCTLDNRHYEVRAINKTDAKLKGTVKGIDTGRKRFHVDTVDFYSARSRAYLLKSLAELFGVEEKVIALDLEKLTLLAEDFTRQSPVQTGPTPAMSEADKDEAMRFLTSPELLTEIVADLETVGYTGEEMNKLLCYIAAVSRKTDEPLSVMIQSRSAAGKSCLQDAILSLIPEEDFIKYTRLTDQALFYRDGPLAHKILAIEELDGMNGALYSIRTIQSSKKITIAYTGKDPATGKMQTEENTVEGPLMVFITTTQPEIDGETASRFLFISIDESTEMTEKIMARQRTSHTLDGILAKLKGTNITRKHHNAGRLLQPIKVANPYSELLTFTSKSLRARRDNTKYLGLIQAIAFLFQYQRKKHRIDYGDGKTMEYINATLADIDHANSLAAEVLGRSLDELSPPSRKLLMLIRKMCDERAEEGEAQYTFLRRDIREYSGWSDFQVRTHIKQLEELEYIYSVTGRRGKEYVHELLAKSGGEDGKPFMIGLIDMEQLRKKAAELGIGDDDGV